MAIELPIHELIGLRKFCVENAIRAVPGASADMIVTTASGIEAYLLGDSGEKPSVEKVFASAFIGPEADDEAPAAAAPEETPAPEEPA
jgi:hypothetical protein